ncbi:SDR family oxidoreductase [Serratia sp. AKBS12]|uniref:SDR family oxidoreductase n=1 Tax=Serratia sp. AKBS12 TaxID=2974597 RepID=UPI002164FDDB|nr:SDR family oxidoreductase [Serratia sp. AKBS12]MCS3408103.1 SDR family oxidoreductase [Serratia sp. AKBS12]HEI8866225.1 SDR family oxidoreductase [Serratia odorifera]
MEQRNQPAQHQDEQPGFENEMLPEPVYDDPAYRAGGKLEGKVAIITGGDSGIGRAATIAYVKEGAKVTVVYLDEDEDAKETKRCAAKYGGEILLLKGDLRDNSFVKQIVAKTIANFGKLDILVNNAGEQHPVDQPEMITEEQLEKTFATNFFSMVKLTQTALEYLPRDGAIINTSSVTAYHGNPDLIDYSATKGAITAFTRSLALKLCERGIRVNSVAPGPIWTPLIPASFGADKVAKFGKDTPMKRPGQPSELAAAYVYLASSDSSYMTGQTLHINGGMILNG